MKSSLRRIAATLTSLTWRDFSGSARARVAELLLDAFASAAVGRRADPYPDFIPGSDGGALLWFRDTTRDPSHAALVNGTVAHHAELDDGNPRASLHGGVTVIPAALAVAETTGATGEALLAAVASGYSAAVACGRPLKSGIETHRLHPPSMVGCFDAAAAAARLLDADTDEDMMTGALALAGTLMPLGPFESFTRGASVKDLYGGYPAYIGVQAALLSRSGVRGPDELFESKRDGVGAFLGHAATPAFELDLDEVLHVELKPWPACRSVHAALTALEKLLPIEVPIVSVHVETYAFAAELSEDADANKPIGAKASIPHAIAALAGQPIAGRVKVDSSEAVGPRGARVCVLFADGTERVAETSAPRSETDARAKMAQLLPERATGLEAAVDALPEAEDLSELVSALRGPLD